MTSICCCCAVIPVAAVNRDRSMSCSFLSSSSDIVDGSSSDIIVGLNDFLIGFVGPRGLHNRDQETDRFDIGGFERPLPHHSLGRRLRRGRAYGTKEGLSLFLQGIRLWKIDYFDMVYNRSVHAHLAR